MGDNLIVTSSTDFRLRPIYQEVGFDYQQAIRDLNRELSYEEIAECCGYKSSRSVLDVLLGQIPSHPKGEALWALYCEYFGRRPPLKMQRNAHDITD